MHDDKTAPGRRAVVVGALSLGLGGVAPKGAAWSATASSTEPISLEGRARLTGGRAVIIDADNRPVSSEGLSIGVRQSVEQDVFVVDVASSKGRTASGDHSLTVVFEDLPVLEQGVQLWRYTPWNAWTKPMAVTTLADLQASEVQFFYWRDHDGLYGAAVPLSGHGFRTTLGGHGGGLAAKAFAGADLTLPATLPILAVGYGRDPHEVIAKTYRAALMAMGKSSNTIAKKTFPAALTSLGWNTWNASNLGKDLSAAFVLETVASLRKDGVPFGWIVLDDGYFSHKDGRLRSFQPDERKFPGGFAPLITALKRDHGVRHVGAWLALDGYWHGLDPDSELGRAYGEQLFSWTERRDRVDPKSAMRTNHFIKPGGPAMARYYQDHLGALKAQGVDFVKVDNQLVVERMAAGNYPVWTLASAMHTGLESAARRHFEGAVINCMDMTADAYFNFGQTSVARAVEDYFPYKPGENYDLQEGNAAAHVLQAVHNALYFGQMVFPDFDMFESTNPNARLHAVARAANNGPICVTDRPGQHDAALLKALVLEDGRALRADTPLVPTTDSLFQLQAAKPFKAFSRSGDVALLAVLNLADADRVEGAFSAADLPGLGGRPVVAYDYLSGRLIVLPPGETAPVQLGRFGSQLWGVQPIEAGLAALGRVDKINGAAVLASAKLTTTKSIRKLEFILREGGPCAAYSDQRPSRVTVDGRAVDFNYHSGLVIIDSAIIRGPSKITVAVNN